MFKATLHSDLARDWRATMRVVSDGLTKGVELGCKEGAEEARSQHRYQDHTRKLTDSISGRLLNAALGGAVGEIVATAKYASYVDGGTPAHDIWPKAGQRSKGPLREGQSRRTKTDIGTHRVALRWSSGGEYHFARMVHHPGTKAYGFMAQAHDKCERVMIREIELGVERAQRTLDR